MTVSGNQIPLQPKALNRRISERLEPGFWIQRYRTPIRGSPETAEDTCSGTFMFFPTTSNESNKRRSGNASLRLTVRGAGRPGRSNRATILLTQALLLPVCRLHAGTSHSLNEILQTTGDGGQKWPDSESIASFSAGAQLGAFQGHDNQQQNGGSYSALV